MVNRSEFEQSKSSLFAQRAPKTSSERANSFFTKYSNDAALMDKYRAKPAEPPVV